MKLDEMKNLLRNLVNEEAVPGLDTTKKVNKESKKFNDEYQKEVESKMKDYESGYSDEEEVTDNKFNADDKQKEYHDEMETLNGQEMITYDQDPNEKFKERAEKAITGDSKMGNKVYTGKHNPETGEGNGNTESTWGASDDKFGEKLVDRMKSSNKKRNDASKSITQFGDDIEIGKPSDKTDRKLGIKEGVENPMADPNYTHFAVLKSTNKILDGWNYSDIENEELKSEKQAYFFEDLDDFISNGMKKSDILITTRKNMEKKGIDPTNSENWYKIGSDNENIQENKTGMKRLKFKQPFNGVDTAKKVIPEHYKKDDLVFEMTDGNETYRIRWEGSVNEGEAVVLEAENKQLMEESREKVFKLMNFNPRKAQGLRKAKDKIDENEKVGDFMAKAKKFLNENKDKSEE